MSRSVPLVFLSLKCTFPCWKRLLGSNLAPQYVLKLSVSYKQTHVPTLLVCWQVSYCYVWSSFAGLAACSCHCCCVICPQTTPHWLYDDIWTAQCHMPILRHLKWIVQFIMPAVKNIFAKEFNLNDVHVRECVHLLLPLSVSLSFDPCK